MVKDTCRHTSALQLSSTGAVHAICMHALSMRSDVAQANNEMSMGT